MTEEQSLNEVPTSGELGTLRTILFGEQQRDIENQFSEMAAVIESFRSEFDARLQSLKLEMDAKVEASVREARTDANNKISALRLELLEMIRSVDHENASRQQMSQLLTQMSQQLMDDAASPNSD